MNFENIPDEMKAMKAWVCWKYEEREGKRTKVPYQANGKGRADSTAPVTWATFAQAVRSSAVFEGIGFVLSAADPFVAVDLDHCIGDGGALSEEAAAIVERLASYTEITPSGSGLRVLVRGELPPKGRKRGNTEMYEAARFVTMTGRRFGAPSPIEDRHEEIAAIHAEVFPAPLPAQRNGYRPVETLALSDQEILTAAFAAKNGAALNCLWRGDYQGAGYASPSEADSALCWHLAFWTGRDPARMDRLFRDSGLMREKWDAPRGPSTYGAITIERAVEGCTETYTGPGTGISVNSVNSVNATARLKPHSNNNKQIEVLGVPASVDTDESVDTVDTVDRDIQGWEAIVPLAPTNLPLFPVDTFPPWLCEFVTALAYATQTPVDLPAMMSLSALSACVSKRAMVKPKLGWTEPLNVYTVTFLEPGNRKSAVVHAVRKPIAEYEGIARVEAVQERARDGARRQMQEARQKEAARKAVSASVSERSYHEEEAMRLAAEVAAMPERGEFRLFTEDCTPEKLVGLLADNEGRIAILTAEGDTFDIMSGRYSDKANLGVYLKAHSGETLLVDRVGRTSERVEEPALTIGMSTQPEVLRGLLTKPTLRGRGLLGRFLYSIPQELVGWREIDTDPVPEEIAEAYSEALSYLFSVTQDGAAVKTLSFTAEARDVLRAYEAAVEIDLRRGNSMGDMTDWGGKLVGAVVRISGLLHLATLAGIRQELAYEIPAPIVCAAIRIGYYLAEHARAAFAHMGADPEIGSAQYILSWVERNNQSEFTQRDAYRAMARRFKKPEDMAPPLSLLVSRNFLRELATEKVDKRAHPSPRFAVNPEVFKKGSKK